MGRLEPVVTRVPRARRQSLLLTSRRHIDLLRVSSARSPLS
ncbi:putative leader peptide [Streptomyces europaeiscabiei]|nr:putative leader peptide [Streptomyces europaeiscabiei]